MGGQACKCECDGDKKSEGATAASVTRSPYGEQVDSRNPTLPAAAAMQATPATASTVPEPKATEPRVYEPPAPAPVPEKKAFDEQKKVYAVAGEKKLCFELDVAKPLNARFAELAEPADIGGALVATSISEKSVLTWQKDGSMGLCPGDVILGVNGEYGSKDKVFKCLADAKQAGGNVEISVKPRPDTFQVMLQKTGDEKMGVVVAVHDDINDKVEVRQVSDEGAVPSFNEKNYQTQVVSGDWVTAVNGVSKGANEMIQDMQDCWKSGSRLVVSIAAYPSEAMRNSKKKSDA